MRYPGGKNLIFRRLINLMPPHEVYVEPFLGSGAVLRHKVPAPKSIGLDLNPIALAEAESWHLDGLELINDDALHFLKCHPFTAQTLIYCDPPYLPSTRKSKAVYRHELTEDQHRELLQLLTILPCKVMLSGYPHPLYEQMLEDWHSTPLMVPSHIGLREERVWTNFPPPSVPQDLRYIGETFRDREQVKRRHSRLMNRIADLSCAERALLFSRLCSDYPDQLSTALEAA
ncbi:DNA adenine methylase [Achromobacter sp. 413638]|uniref:DNA adenine methylase n=1 Tax=Achromobacter sp. 413638 TaxID=3342385 RepID=UPI00370C301F